jgi:hypothetical protein
MILVSIINTLKKQILTDSGLVTAWEDHDNESNLVARRIGHTAALISVLKADVRAV